MRATVVFAMGLALLGCSVEATEKGSASAATDPNHLTGTVLETIDAATYTYVRLDTSSGETWAAVPQARLEVGAQVVIENPQAMQDFESRTLERTFDTIYFGTIEGGGSASPMATGGANPHGSSGGAVSQGSLMKGHGSDSAPIAVEKADGSNARTVAELFAEKADFSGKTVTIRGKVVKYTGGIMGRNWIHLQDGTGDASAGTNDITVTSSDATAVGEIIVVQGTVAVDKDFGAGYRYAVIVEDASIR